MQAVQWWLAAIFEETQRLRWMAPAFLFHTDFWRPILKLLSWWNISRLGPDVIPFLPIWLNFTRVLKLCILLPSLEQRDFASIFLNHRGLRFVKLKGWCEWLRLKGWLLNTVWFGLPGKCCRWIGLVCAGRLISGKAFRAVLCSPHNSGLISSLKPHSGHDPACA